MICAIWIHLPQGSSQPWYLICAIFGVLCATTVFQILAVLYRNGAFGNSWTSSEVNRLKDKSMCIEIRPGRPALVFSGQYINLWCPSLNPLSRFQCSSFVVTSWSAEEQDKLRLFTMCPSRTFGFSWRLLNTFHRKLRLMSGPHGASEPVLQDEIVVLVASDTGILPIRPYVEQLFYCVKKKNIQDA